MLTFLGSFFHLLLQSNNNRFFPGDLPLVCNTSWGDRGLCGVEMLTLLLKKTVEICTNCSNTTRGNYTTPNNLSKKMKDWGLCSVVHWKKGKGVDRMSILCIGIAENRCIVLYPFFFCSNVFFFLSK